MTLVTFVVQVAVPAVLLGGKTANCIFEPRGSRSTRKLVATAPTMAAGFNQEMWNDVDRNDLLDANTP